MREALLACAKETALRESAPRAPAASAATLPVAARAPAAEAASRADAPARSRRPFWVFAALMAVALAGGGLVTVLARQNVAARKGHPDSIAPAEAATVTPTATPTSTATPTATPTPTPTATPTPTPAAAPPPPADPPPPTAEPVVKPAPPPIVKERRRPPPPAEPAVSRRERAEGLLGRAEQRRSEHDVDGAIRLYLQAEAVDPSLAEVQKKLALCYQLKGDTARAAERWELYLASDPPDAEKVRAIVETLR
jgi:hypothetical protein